MSTKKIDVSPSDTSPKPVAKEDGAEKQDFEARAELAEHAYIEACEERDFLRAQLAELRKKPPPPVHTDHDPAIRDEHCPACACIKPLSAPVAAPEQPEQQMGMLSDAERLDWLDNYRGADTNISLWKTISLGKGAWMVDVGNGDDFEGFKQERIVEFAKTVREAIDAAVLAASLEPGKAQDSGIKKEGTVP